MMMKKSMIVAIVACLLILGCATGPEKKRPKDPASTGVKTVIEETNKIIRDTIRTTGKEVRKETRRVIRGK